MKQVGFISFRQKKMVVPQGDTWQVLPFNKQTRPSENITWLSDLPAEELWLHEIALYRDIKPITFVPTIRYTRPINESQLIDNAKDFAAIVNFMSEDNRYPNLNLNGNRLSLSVSADRKMLQTFSKMNFDRINSKIPLQISHSIIESFDVEKKEDLPKKFSVIQLYPILNQYTSNRIKFPKGAPQFVGYDEVQGITAASFATLDFPFFIKLVAKKLKPQFVDYRSILDKLLLTYNGCSRLEREWFFKDEFIFINRYFDFSIMGAVIFDNWDENSDKYFADLDTSDKDEFTQNLINRIYWQAKTEHDETQPQQFISGLSGAITNTYIRSKIILPFCLQLKDNGFNILSVHPQYIEVFFDDTHDNTVMLQLLLRLTEENNFKFVGA